MNHKTFSYYTAQKAKRSVLPFDQVATGAPISTEVTNPPSRPVETHET